jgi:hypothetical protein
VLRHYWPKVLKNKKMSHHPSCASQKSTSTVIVLKYKCQTLPPQLCQSKVNVKSQPAEIQIPSPTTTVEPVNVNSQSAEIQIPNATTPVVPVNSQRQQSSLLKYKYQTLPPQLCQSTVSVKSQSAEIQMPNATTPVVPVNVNSHPAVSSPHGNLYTLCVRFSGRVY